MKNNNSREWIEQQPKTEYWNPETKGEELEGVITNIVLNSFGKKAYTIMMDDGKEKITPTHSQLVGRMEDVKLKDRIKIVYEGEKERKNGNPLKLYKVYKEPREERVV